MYQHNMMRFEQRWKISTKPNVWNSAGSDPSLTIRGFRNILNSSVSPWNKDLSLKIASKSYKNMSQRWNIMQNAKTYFCMACTVAKQCDICLQADLLLRDKFE